jgi:hypothetical protein
MTLPPSPGDRSSDFLGCSLAMVSHVGNCRCRLREWSRDHVGSTARLLVGVFNLSASEAKARAGHAELLAPRRSLTGEELPPLLPSTAAELAAGTVGPTHVRVITAVKCRSYTMM